MKTTDTRAMKSRKSHQESHQFEKKESRNLLAQPFVKSVPEAQRSISLSTRNLVWQGKSSPHWNEKPKRHLRRSRRRHQALKRSAFRSVFRACLIQTAGRHLNAISDFFFCFFFWEGGGKLAPRMFREKASISSELRKAGGGESS